MFKDIAELREQIKAFGLERHEEKIVALAKPAIRMLPTRVEDDDIPIGASKLGGNPDLPPDFEWKTYEGKPLTFIGQFKLSEIAPYDSDRELPAKGMLYFFFYTDDVIFGDYAQREAWQVIFVENESSVLVRTKHPVVKTEYGLIKALPSHKTNYASFLTLPLIDYKDHLYYELDFSVDEEMPYAYLQEYELSHPAHYFLGHPYPIQSYVEWECATLSKGLYTASSDEQHLQLKTEMKDWRLLFQIDSDDDLNMMWGDVGTLYICLRKGDLASKSFDKAWTIMQCT